MILLSFPLNSLLKCNCKSTLFELLSDLSLKAHSSIANFLLISREVQYSKIGNLSEFHRTNVIKHILESTT